MISIILPVFNSENYIEMCINSILSQTFESFELIIINDGSTDNTLDILKKVAIQDERVKILNLSNGGVSNARNKGIEKSKGKYICFIDSDDCYNVNFLSTMYELIQRNDSDIAMCNFSYYQNKPIKINKISLINSENKYSYLLSEHCFQGYVWNKIYKSSIIEDVKFDSKIDYLEDLLFNVHLFNKTDSIVFTDQVLYNYVLNENSAINTISEKNFSYFTALEKIRGSVPIENHTDIDIRVLFGLLDMGSKAQFKNRNLYLKIKNKFKYEKNKKMAFKISSKIKRILLNISKINFFMGTFLYGSALRFNNRSINIKKRIEK